jgi:hypothetical protein
MRFSIISTIILAPLALAAATPKAEPAPEITSRKLALGSILSLLPVGSLDPDCVAGCVGNITTCVKPTADLTSLLSVLKWYGLSFLLLLLLTS